MSPEGFNSRAGGRRGGRGWQRGKGKTYAPHYPSSPLSQIAAQSPPAPAQVRVKSPTDRNNLRRHGWRLEARQFSRKEADNFATTIFRGVKTLFSLGIVDKKWSSKKVDKIVGRFLGHESVQKSTPKSSAEIVAKNRRRKSSPTVVAQNRRPEPSPHVMSDNFVVGNRWSLENCCRNPTPKIVANSHRNISSPQWGARTWPLDSMNPIIRTTKPLSSVASTPCPRPRPFLLRLSVLSLSSSSAPPPCPQYRVIKIGKCHHAKN